MERNLILTSILGLLLVIPAQGGRPQQIASPDPMPEGLEQSDWQGIRAAHEAWKHRLHVAEGGWQARNPRQQWTTRLDGRGFLATPGNADWTWGLEFQHFGFGERHNDFRLVVGETAAHYPLTIEPIAQQACLKASNTNSNDWFGRSVAISGDTVVVGANFEDSSTTGVNSTPNNNAWESGAVYVFVRNAGTWSQQAYIKASNTGAGDEFGFAVALSGDTLVVGAYGEDSGTTGVNSTPNNSASDAGAAYVFVRNGGVWSQQAYLKASNSGGFDWFGRAVAVSGNTVVVGALQEDSNTTGVNSTPNNISSNSGAAYVFVRSGVTWSQQAYLKASNTNSSDQFGISVAVSCDTVVAGANFGDSSVPNSGAAYVFVRDGTSWSQQALLKASNVGIGDEFGWSVDVSGDTLLVAAPGEDSNTSGVNGIPNDVFSASGAAYVFVRSGTSWSQQAFLKASNPWVDDRFGYEVALCGNTAVVGAPLEDSSTIGVNSAPNDAAPNSGAAYVFARSGTTWSQQAYLKASNTGAYDNFGTTVGVSGGTVVVGSLFEDGGTTGVNGTPDETAPNAGAAYIFTGVGSGDISAGRSAALIFIQNAGLCGPDAELAATPFDDGVGNLLKYAFNMNLAGPDSRTMSPGGVAGLPLISVIPDGEAGIFRFEFLRRKNSGLIYIPQKSVDMAGSDSWTPLLDSPTVTSIDDDWERAVYEEIYDAQSTPRSFGRVTVDLP